MAAGLEVKPDLRHSEDTSAHFGQKNSQFDTPPRGTSLAELDYYGLVSEDEMITFPDIPAEMDGESEAENDEESHLGKYCDSSCPMLFDYSPKRNPVRSKSQHLSDTRRARDEISRLSGIQPPRSVAFRRQLAVVALRVEDRVHDAMIDLPQVPTEIIQAVFVDIPHDVFWIISDVVEAQGGLRSLGRRFFGR